MNTSPIPPTVVALKRRGGVVVQDCDVYIGRRWTMGGWNLAASKWGNPFRKGPGMTAEEMLAKYEALVRGTPELWNSLHELTSKACGCWVHRPCHGDILVKLWKERYGEK